MVPRRIQRIEKISNLKLHPQPQIWLSYRHVILDFFKSSSTSNPASSLMFTISEKNLNRFSCSHQEPRGFLSPHLLSCRFSLLSISLHPHGHSLSPIHCMYPWADYYHSPLTKLLASPPSLAASVSFLTHKCDPIAARDQAPCMARETFMTWVPDSHCSLNLSCFRHDNAELCIITQCKIFPKKLCSSRLYQLP